MPQETLTLPLAAAFGWDGKGGELELAPGSPKSQPTALPLVHCPASHPAPSMEPQLSPVQPLTMPGPATRPQPHTSLCGQPKTPCSGKTPSLSPGASICCTTGAGASPAPVNPGARGGCAGRGVNAGDALAAEAPFVTCLCTLPGNCLQSY